MIGFVKNKKSWLFIITCFVVFIQLFGLLMMPLPVEAGLPVAVDADAPAEVKDVKKTIGATILSTAMGGLMNAFSYFMRKLAYDSAMYLASGGKGQGALAFKDGFGSYIKNVALDSVATMVEEIGKPFGLNLCQTPDLNFQVYLQIGIRNMYVTAEGGQGPQPSCTFQQLKGAWSADAFAQKYGSAEGMMEKAFNNAIRVENSDFGIAYGAMAQVDRNKAQKEGGAKSQRLEGGGFKAATGLIDNKIKTPSKVVEEETMSVTNKGQSTMTAGQVAGVYGSGMLQVIPQALSVFLNTFISQGLKTVMGLLTGDDSGGSGGGDHEAGVVSFDSAAIVSNRQKAHAAFSQLLTIKLSAAQNYSILEEMALCPSLDDPNVVMGPDHCVIDTDFKMALDRARMGTPLTIEQAIKENLLHGDWILVSPKRVADNTSPNCAQGKYCYSNIQKLRRNRVLPLGFEIAAYYADPDEPEKDKKWTLKTVMDGFSNCQYVKDDKGNNIVDPHTKQPKVVADPENHPYCHLIDPNWILKAPTAQCNVMAYGSTLQDTQTGVRAQYCADLRTCLKEEPGKACDANQYGYCTRERNVWRFAGDSCNKVYNTCAGYFSRAGELNYFLARTLDYGECSMSSIGCRGYSAYKTESDEWLPTFSAGSLAHKQEGVNQAYYFNEKIKTDSCGQAEEGCSKFYLGERSGEVYQNSYADDDLRFVKKAPNYLHCYDTDLATIKIDWPKTKPELAKLKPEKRCSEFAQACLPEEVDCDLYTPQTGASKEPIPAKIGENQVCDKDCVGYDALEQEATNFEYSVFPLYFIPTNGKECSESVKGCDEFTNIDELAKGGEGLEYFYDLRYCEKPENNNEAAYYSWEGSETEGYVLKIHKLRPYTENDFQYISKLGLPAGINVAEAFPAGSPAYNSDDMKFLEDEYSFCNKEGYSKLILGGDAGIPGVANEDCRALYDKSGKVYYRLLADTVEVSDACHPLRKTKSTYWEDKTLKNDKDGCSYKNGKWEGSDAVGICQRCLRGGFYNAEKDACVYWTTGAYGSCTKEMNGCRKYTGNQGNNIESIASLSFEPDGKDANALNKVKTGWSPANTVSVAAESLQVGLHSLQVKGGTVGYELPSSTLSKGSLYTLSFWARGENVKLSISMKQNGEKVGMFTSDLSKQVTTTLSVGYDWRKYQLGPVTFSGISGENVILEFQGAPAGKMYFIDNLQLFRLNDTYYLIKDSWKTQEGYNVPAVCDDTPADPYPGKALGCRAYTQDSTGLLIYATSFESLCREEAVGCRAVYDTYNTEEEELTLYNIWCAVTSTPQDGKCKKSIKTIDAEEIQECEVPQNDKGCFIDKLVVPDGVDSNVWSGWVVSSTIITPADTPSNSPLYLTVHKNFQCTEKDLGCQAFGLEDIILPTIVSNTEAYLLNNPAKYVGPDGVLCRDDLVGCEEFKAGNEIAYFKDPKLVGNTLCEYKPAGQNNGASPSGWFQKDVGYCYDPDGNWVDKLCRSANDCGKDYSCQDMGTAPCYSDYLLAGGEYGLWSNGNVKYAGMVGMCPEEANNCSELLDPMDRDQSNPDDLGRAYYMIYDQKLLSGLNECEGQVSWKKGCVLFNKTDQPNLFYDATATYNISSKSNPPHGLVGPSSSEKNDANVLIKVTRDRECGEWLACRGSLPIPDSQSQSGERYACYALQPCREGNNFYCSQEATAKEYGADEILNYEKYVTRDVSWFTGNEYDGYSLFNKYPVADFDFVSIKKNDTGKKNQSQLTLGYVAESENGLCKGPSTNGKKCAQGVCYEHECIYPLSGKYASEFNKKTSQEDRTKSFGQYLANNSCRAYPEQDSPFTDKVKTIVQTWNNGRPVNVDSKYTNSALCQDKENCDCNYVKVGYGQSGNATENRYYGWNSKHNDILLGGICQGGSNEGQACATADNCGDVSLGAQCLKPQKKSKQIGWNGYCLEPDISRRVANRTDNASDAFACLTWYPLDYAPGLFDIYYNDPGKGYVPPVPGAGEVYCAEASATNNLSKLPPVKQKAVVAESDYNALMSLAPTCEPLIKWECDGDMVVDCPDTRKVINDFVCSKIESEYWCESSWLETFNLDVWLLSLDSLNPCVAFLTSTNPGLDCAFPASFNYCPQPLGSQELWQATIKKAGKYFSFGWQKYQSLVRYMLSGLPAGNSLAFGLEYGDQNLDQNHVYEYISRVDTSLGNNGGYFAWDVETDNNASHGHFFDDYSDYALIRPILFMSKLVMDRHNVNKSTINKWKPLLPEPGLSFNTPDGNGDFPSIILEDDEVKDAEDDSGIIINKPTDYEKFLNKNNILAISIIPLLPECEMHNLTDCTNHYENPAMGYAHQILINGKYPLIGSGAPQSDILFNRSTLANNTECKYCKWWVAKTEYSTDPIDVNKKVATEGYLWQWWEDDPVNSENSWTEYANNSTHLVNPLEFKNNYAPYDVVKCLDDRPEINWYAIEFLFDKQSGQFLGYRSRTCENSSYDHGLSVAISWRLRPMCLKSAVVFDISKEPTNKAYTDRVWDNSVFSISPIGQKLEYSTASSPFGSGKDGREATQLGEKKPWLFYDTDMNAVNAGYPWSCAAIPGFSGLCSFVPAKFGNDYMSIPRTSGPSTFSNSVNDVDYWKLGRLDQLFTKFFEVRKYSGVEAGAPEWKKEQNSATDSAVNKGKSPHIYPAINCVGEVCKLDKTQDKYAYGFSVNGIAGKSADEALFGVSNKAATARFFTWADHNQMPLRRIMIDWHEQDAPTGLGTVAGDTTGYYSNYKPYCADGGKVNECYITSELIKKESKDPVLGWLGKEPPDLSEHFQGPIACTKMQDCVDELTKIIDDGRFGFAEDYPALNMVGCNGGKCYEILKKADIANGIVVKWTDGWFKVKCKTNDDCFDACNELNVDDPEAWICKVGSKNVVDKINEGYEYLCDKDWGECFMIKPTQYAANPIIGWKGKIEPSYYKEKEGSVACANIGECVTKFNNMVINGFGTTEDYPKSTDLVCGAVDKLCHQNEYALNPDLPVNLTGLTCKDSNECPIDYSCVDVGVRFGNQSGITCVDRPAQRFFNYTCDADRYKGVYTNKNEKEKNDIPQYVFRVDEIGGVFGVSGWKDFLKKKGYKDDSLVCVYKPRMQVLDNWEWCSGSCLKQNGQPLGGADFRPGCYNGLVENDITTYQCDNAGEGQRLVQFSNIIVVAP